MTSPAESEVQVNVYCKQLTMMMMMMMMMMIMMIMMMMMMLIMMMMMMMMMMTLTMKDVFGSLSVSKTYLGRCPLNH